MARVRSVAVWSALGAFVIAGSAFARDTTEIGGAEQLADTRGKSSARRDATPVVTFAGFRAHEDGSSTLHVDMTGPAEVTFEHKGLSIVYLLRGAKIRFKNNENPLVAEHFGANVRSAKLDRTKTGVTLTVHLRTETTASHRLVEGTEGALLEIDVPPPTASAGAR